ncbi:helix-turn-helix transcriptional regulator [Aeromonas schubertii]|uniref:Helix-turn-helix transcriptional regulator n=1 Tax=Aeromonas schubertii TaxID=652 RepID=A0ABS7VGW3_9GAMM|nr:helix-turn-helix transcriptional regulator [Aeromonas schubertii]MBZ6068281.1 helix-turn-helix transcriptional regulator [Aeromonas schubertii]MBZ6072142.1 helix-turn-helix transcriptional regulator [Aeromonas schubertii]
MLRTAQERLPHYLAQLYECGINDSDINLVLEEVRRDSGSALSLLLLRDEERNGRITLFSSGLSEAQHHYYIQHHRQDIWFNHYLEKGCKGVVKANTLSNKAGLLAGFGAHFAIGGVCRVSGYGLASVSSYRDQQQTDFGDKEIDVWDGLYFGLASWSRHYWNLVGLELQNHQLQQLIKHQNKAVAIVDEKGGVQYSNAEFNRIADDNHELRMQHGVLSVNNKDQQRQFRELLAGFTYSTPGSPRYLSVTRGGGLRPLLLQASLMSGLRNAERYIELVIRDPDHAFSPDIAAMGNLYPLTSGERELLLLLSKGYSSSDIAELRGVKVETVRSTLKSVFKKTDCHSQSELLLLLQSIS